MSMFGSWPWLLVFYSHVTFLSDFLTLCVIGEKPPRKCAFIILSALNRATVDWGLISKGYSQDVLLKDHWLLSVTKDVGRHSWRTFCTVTNLCNSQSPPSTLITAPLGWNSPLDHLTCNPDIQPWELVLLKVSVKQEKMVFPLLSFSALSFWNWNWKPGQNSEHSKQDLFNIFKSFSWRELVEEILCFFSNLTSYFRTAAISQELIPKHLCGSQSQASSQSPACSVYSLLNLFTEGQWSCSEL